ncbi:MAG: DNA topoisomerase IB [Longimicrobiales bacterium]
MNWWRREGSPRDPTYAAANGRRLLAPAALERIRLLRIPPAWDDVHIAPDPDRKIQAWGYDAKGRKQYIYSHAHVEQRDRRKWRRVLQVAEVLPHLRFVTNEHLRRRELDAAKVHATVVRLMCRACFRAGSERYAVSNKTFGITTLCKHHVSIRGHNLVFAYRGKRSKDQRQVVADTPLVHIIEELLALPGERLFQYQNGLDLRSVTSNSVNRYLRRVLGARYTSKDLRTFGGTVRAATILADIGPARTTRESKNNLLLACKLVAHELGNTPAIARKAYIHPAVLAEYARAGRTVANLRRSARRVELEEPLAYYPEEARLMTFLQRYG